MVGFHERGVLLMPLITTGMFLLFLFLPGMDPLKANIAQFRAAYGARFDTAGAGKRIVIE